MYVLCMYVARLSIWLFLLLTSFAFYFQEFVMFSFWLFSNAKIVNLFTYFSVFWFIVASISFYYVYLDFFFFNSICMIEKFVFISISRIAISEILSWMYEFFLLVIFVCLWSFYLLLYWTFFLLSFHVFKFFLFYFFYFFFSFLVILLYIIELDENEWFYFSKIIIILVHF